jgi:hypothetical protein
VNLFEIVVVCIAVYFCALAFWLGLKLKASVDECEIERVRHRVTQMYLDRERYRNRDKELPITATDAAMYLDAILRTYDAERRGNVADFWDERERTRFWVSLKDVIEEARACLAKIQFKKEEPA